jgi:glycosyltransferase involved in cell wall biosynthesis
VDYSIHELAQQYSLESLVEFIPYVSHEEVIRYQKGASCLLLLLNQSQNAKGILPGKFFEYMASKVPILCLGPLDSDAAGILDETGCGNCVEYNDEEALMVWFSKLSEMKDIINPSTKIGSFTRKRLCSYLAKDLESITN